MKRKGTDMSICILLGAWISSEGFQKRTLVVSFSKRIHMYLMILRRLKFENTGLDGLEVVILKSI